MIDPEDCRTMAEVRTGVVALDERIPALPAANTRFRNVAARARPARANATLQRMLPASAGGARQLLVEASIAQARVRWDEIGASR